MKCFRRVLHTGDHDQYRVEYEAASGETLVFESRVARVLVGGRAIGLTVNSSDITADVRAHNERMRLVSLVENSSDFVALADLEANVTYVNAAGLARWGLRGSILRERLASSTS